MNELCKDAKLFSRVLCIYVLRSLGLANREMTSGWINATGIRA
jgi:hypothetical protein